MWILESVLISAISKSAKDLAEKLSSLSAAGANIAMRVRPYWHDSWITIGKSLASTKTSDLRAAVLKLTDEIFAQLPADNANAMARKNILTQLRFLKFENRQDLNKVSEIYENEMVKLAEEVWLRTTALLRNLSANGLVWLE